MDHFNLVALKILSSQAAKKEIPNEYEEVLEAHGSKSKKTSGKKKMHQRAMNAVRKLFSNKIKAA